MAKIVKHNVIIMSIGDKVYRYTETIEEIASKIDETIDLTNDEENSSKPASPFISSEQLSPRYSPQYTPTYFNPDSPSTISLGSPAYISSPEHSTQSSNQQ